MVKAILAGIGNEGDFTYLTVYKNKDFFKWLSSMLKDSFGMVYLTKHGECNKRGIWVEKKKKMADFIDVHEDIRDDNTRVDLFYGKNKIFIGITTTKIKRKLFLKKLASRSRWTKKTNQKLRTVTTAKSSVKV